MKGESIAPTVLKYSLVGCIDQLEILKTILKYR
jgi:hypothetical protein